MFRPPNAYFWQARCAKGAPYVGIMTWEGPPYIDGEELDRSPRFQALIRNETTSRAILQGDHIPVEVDGIFLRNIEKISQAQYQDLVAHSEYSTAHAPMNPDAAPNEAVNFMKIIPF